MLGAKTQAGMLRRSTGHASFTCSRRLPALNKLIRNQRCIRLSATNDSKDKAATTTAEAGSKAAATEMGSAAGSAATAAAVADPWKWESSNDAVVAYGVLAGVLLLGAVPGNPALRSNNSLDLFYFISLAVCTQYIGAHKALTTTQRQQLSIKEGLLAPLLASVSLFSLYLIIRFLPDLNLSTLVNAYFWLLGSFAGVGALGPMFRVLGGPLGQKTISINTPDGWFSDEQGKPVNKVEFAPSDVLAISVAVGLSTANLINPTYTLNNTMACLIASDILQLIGIRSFRVAGALLVGLLLYDVFWVFGSPEVVGDNVMLAVATSDVITGPSRLLFPKSPGGLGEAADYPYSLLGLGDIAVPGLLACLSLRYDASRAVDMKGRADAAFSGIQAAMDAMPSTATSKQMAESAAAAAEAAFDRFADAELEQRQRSLDGVSSNGSQTDSAPGGSPARIPPTDAVLSQRTYFTPVMVAYVGGLLMAFAANSITHLGQPALLYIVPSTLGAVLLTALLRDELGRIWQFTDVPSFGLPTEANGRKENS